MFIEVIQVGMPCNGEKKNPYFSENEADQLDISSKWKYSLNTAA